MFSANVVASTAPVAAATARVRGDRWASANKAQPTTSAKAVYQIKRCAPSTVLANRAT